MRKLTSGKRFAIGSDVAALAVLVGLLPERQALVHADDLDAEAPRLLDEADADLVVEVEAVPVRSPLRVGLPRADAELLLEPRHVLEVARLVRVDAAVDHQPVVALHAVDDAAHVVRGLDLERRGLAARRHERQHHHVRVAVEEHVLHEFLGREAGEVAARRLAVGQRAAGFRGPAEGRFGRDLEPGLGRIDVVALHIEDELAGLELRGRGRGLRGRDGRQVEEPAGPAGRGVGGVESEQRARRAAGREQEVAPAHREALRVRIRGLLGQVIGVPVRPRERHRHELAVAGGIELDRQPAALRVDAMARRLHHRSPRFPCTALPSNSVTSTCVSEISVGGMSKRFLSSTARFARLPTSSEPVLASSRLV